MMCHLEPPKTNAPPAARWHIITEIPHKVARVARTSDITQNPMGGRWRVLLGSSLRARIRTNEEKAETCHPRATQQTLTSP